jgi:indole-3-glycerol phosphate synthase
MPTILDDILRVKRDEVEALAPRRSDLKSAARDAPPARSLAAAVRREKGTPFSRRSPEPFYADPPPPDLGAPIRIIAEVKHRSPSAGVIVEPFRPADLARRYEAGGADAVSCLTDLSFFGGSIDDLQRVRAAVGLPVLRKDFLIDPLQLFEARAAGADAVLLIAEVLERRALEDLAGLAADLGMDVLAEAHSEPALEKALVCGSSVVGINNRDLASLKVSLETTVRLAPFVLNAGKVLVAESGIRSAADVRRLRIARADAILIGEGLLRSPDLDAKIAELKEA